MALSLGGIGDTLSNLGSGNIASVFGGGSKILVGIITGLYYAIIALVFLGLLWVFVLRPSFFKIEIEKHLVEGNRPMETTAKGRIFKGKDGVVKMQIFQGFLKPFKNLPEPPFTYFTTKLLPNGKTKRKIRYLVSSENIWTPLPPLEILINDPQGNPVSKVNIPESDVDLWNMQEKKSVERTLTRESWWERNRDFIQYLAAWAFTIIIVWIVFKNIADALNAAQAAESTCRSIQTQCEITGARLAGVVG